MNNYKSKILIHEFNKAVCKGALPYMMGLISGKPYSPSELEKYSFSLMGWVNRISNCFEDLEHAKVYLNHFRTSSWYREAGITKSNYINYHYCKYAITVVTIMDVALILTNDTLRLGNPEKLCSFDNIIKNSWVISSNFDKPLTKLRSIVEPWREPRNFFIHRGGEIYREVLTALDGYELLCERGIIDKSVSLHRIKLLYKSELSKIFDEFNQVEKPLFNDVFELLSKLLPVYKSWRNRLK
ncbi:MAG: Cthe_2314 family HEPN domain-containing protein [Dehalococcoidales bacterium]